MNVSHDMQSVLDLVRELWPGHRITTGKFQAFWDTRLRKFTSDELSVALRQSRADSPDASSPVWAAIFASLSKPRSDDSALAAEERKIREGNQRFRDQLTAMPADELAALVADTIESVGPIIRRYIGDKSHDPMVNGNLRACLWKLMSDRGMLRDVSVLPSPPSPPSRGPRNTLYG